MIEKSKQAESRESRKKTARGNKATASEWGASDSHSSDDIRWFITTLSEIQYNESLEAALKFVSNLRAKLKDDKKKKPYFYGRVCEELAWAHMYLSSRLTNEYLIPNHAIISKRLELAEPFLIEALSYYTNMHNLPKRNIKPAQLKNVIVEFYKKFPEHHKSSLFRLRMRSIASSLGHLYSKKYPATDDADTNRLDMQFYFLKYLADYEYKGRNVYQAPYRVNVLRQRLLRHFNEIEA